VKKFRCGDVVAGCTATFRGDEVAILAAVARHAQEDHGIAELPDQLVQQVRAAITNA
jgi:predicted small metal-binding protein